MESFTAPKGEQTDAREGAAGKRIFESGFAFSAGALLVVLFSLVPTFFVRLLPQGEGYPDWYVYILYLLPQLAFCAAAALYFFRAKEPVLTLLRPAKPRFFALALMLQFGLLLFLSELNGYFIALLSRLGYTPSASPIPAFSGFGVFFSLLVIALLPAVFEELLFRGILVQGMRKAGWGMWPAALISGALFSLYHGNPEQTVYQFFCGVSFALIAYQARSVFPSMLAHFFNNAAVLTVSGLGFQTFRELFRGSLYPAMMILSALCLFGALFALLWRKRGEGGAKRGKLCFAGRFFSAAACGIAICALEWIAALLLGFSGGA